MLLWLQINASQDTFCAHPTMRETEVIAFEKPATLRERVAEYLREAIMHGRLKPGERLREQDWCEQLKVSRSTLREALRTLEAEKLIEIEPHRGPSVARISKKAAQDLYALRALLEGYAAREFASHADDALIEKLRLQVQRLELEADRQDRNGLLRAKQDFYDVLLKGCNNDLVAEILPGLLSRINLLRATSFSRPRRTPESIREIKQLLSCIENRDPAGAQAAAQRHIRRAQKAAFEVLDIEQDSEKLQEETKSERREASGPARI